MSAAPDISLEGRALLKGAGRGAGARIVDAVAAALRLERRKATGGIAVRVVTNREIRKLNKRFLGHDHATDVIAFPYRDGPGPHPADLPFGDILISVDQARIQAKSLGHSLLRELVTLAAHGTLHLLGHDDRRPSDKRRMFARQDRVVDAVLGR